MGIAALVCSFVVKRVLPIGLLVAGSMGTASLFFVFSAIHQINKYNAEVTHFSRAFVKNASKMSGEEGGKKLGEMLLPQEIDEPCFGLYLAMFCSFFIAAAFVFASLFKSYRVEFLQKDTIQPIARKHGAILIFQGSALLLGLIGYIARY